MNTADVDELMKVRHVLKRSGAAAPQHEPERPHLLVVIDHRETRIYQVEPNGALPERITPFDPLSFGRHLRYVEESSNGQRQPDRASFYEAVARSLHGAGQIVLVGTGTGGRTAMEQLLAELQHHHADVARRVVGTVAVDERHLTENQLLARAREFYCSAVNPQEVQDAELSKCSDPHEFAGGV